MNNYAKMDHLWLESTADELIIDYEEELENNVESKDEQDSAENPGIYGGML